MTNTHPGSPDPRFRLSRRRMMAGSILASVAVLLLKPGRADTANAELIWGFPLNYRANPSYGFGPRTNTDGSVSVHTGVDYPNSSRPPVYAIGDGVVNNVATHANYGRFVEIEHPNGWSSFYAHLDSQSVIRGHAISRGQQLGIMGNTGRSFGVHLHLEMRIRPGGPQFDPVPYIVNAPLPGQPATSPPDTRSFTTAPGGVMTREVGAISGPVEAWVDEGVVRIRYVGAIDTYIVGEANNRRIDDIVAILTVDPGVDQYGNARATGL